jgi:hypothetical protein
MCDGDDLDLVAEDAINNVVRVAQQDEPATTETRQWVPFGRFTNARESMFDLTDEPQRGRSAPRQVPVGRFDQLLVGGRMES